ncbi:MAG TPA: hypothetical protein VII63_08440 [Caulobacteraceae bacterium]
MARAALGEGQTAPLPAADGADLETMKRYFSEARDLTAAARTNSLTAIDYYDSDQYTRQELEKLDQRSQPPIIVNRLKVAINGIVGVTERGRSDPKAWPRNPGEDDQADAATDVLRYIADFNRFKRLKQDCFLDMLVPGTMAALVGVDEDSQVTINQVRWEEFFADPRSRRRDFKDARFIGIAKWMYADDVGALYPDKADAIAAIVDNGVGGGMTPDASFQDRPINAPGTAGAWVDRRQRRLMVVEIYYREAAAGTGRGMSWKRCVFTGADILEQGESPYLDHKGRPDCPVEAMSAYVKRDNSRYGAAWDMLPLQDEINKRRSKALHLLVTSRIEARDASAINVDADVARQEAARPDGVLPFGWAMAPNTSEFAGQLGLLQEAKSELERMGPNPALAGRSDDASGRHLLARQQSGLIELANLYGALEDWELRIYRQCWARAKQFWKAPQFIRVTDDEDAPKFVGLNQPILGPPVVGADPASGAPRLQPSVLGYSNAVAEMDVDIEVDAQPDVGTIAAEQFSELMAMIGSNPAWQSQVPLEVMIQLSTIPHKRGVLDAIKQARRQSQEQQAQASQVAQAHAAAATDETRAKAALHLASGQARLINAVTEAHALHADHAAAGFAAGQAQARADAWGDGAAATQA